MHLSTRKEADSNPLEHMEFLVNGIYIFNIHHGMGQNQTRICTAGFLVLGSIYQGKPFRVRMFDQQPDSCLENSAMFP